jgi:hypothetical protein
MKHQLVFSCINVRPEDLDEFLEMQEKMSEIKFSTFSRHVEWQPVALEMGYGKWLSLKNDPYVRFFRAKYKGERVYVMVHSAIEYVFAKNLTM